MALLVSEQQIARQIAEQYQMAMPYAMSMMMPPMPVTVSPMAAQETQTPPPPQWWPTLEASEPDTPPPQRRCPTPETPETPPPPQWWPMPMSAQCHVPHSHWTVPQNPQTVIIFDWDDTLLCTSYLNKLQAKETPEVVKQHLCQIEDAVRRVLELALQLGHVFIITNAQTGWVDYSAKKYVPNLLPLLQNVRVISARAAHEAQYPEDISQWKIQAFLDVQRQLNTELITNLISIGDADFEMQAVRVMGDEVARAQISATSMDPRAKNRCAQVLVKTIKFREDPDPEDVRKQLEYVTEHFDWIVQDKENLHISFDACASSRSGVEAR